MPGVFSYSRKAATGGLLLLVAARVTRRIGSHRAARVPPELLAIGAEQLKTEQDFAERFNGRASGLIGFSGVVLGLTVTVGVETFSRLTPQGGKAADLRLGQVGEPVFIGCFIVAVALLSLCAGVATTTMLPIGGKRLSIAALRGFAQNRTPLGEVRGRTYDVHVNLLNAQREANRKKAKRVKAAGRLFVISILLVAADACTLAASQLNL